MPNTSHSTNQPTNQPKQPTKQNKTNPQKTNRPFRVWCNEWRHAKSSRYKADLLSKIWEVAFQKRVLHHWRDMKKLADTQVVKAQEMTKRCDGRLKQQVFTAWFAEAKYRLYVKETQMANGLGMPVLNPSLRRFQMLRVMWYYAQARRASRQLARDHYKIDVDKSFDALFGWHGLATSAHPPRLMDGITCMANRKLRSRQNVNDRMLDLAGLCEPIQLMFEAKGSLLRRQIYFEFRTLMPRVMNGLRRYVQHMRRKRFVWKRFCILRQKRLLRLWRRFVFQQQLKRSDGEQRLARSHSQPPGWPCGASKRVNVVRRTTALMANTKQVSEPAHSDRRSSRLILTNLEQIAEIGGGGAIKTYGRGMQRMRVERSMRPSVMDSGLLSHAQWQSLLPRSKSLDENTFELALKEYRASLKVVTRHDDGTDVKEKMERYVSMCLCSYVFAFGHGAEVDYVYMYLVFTMRIFSLYLCIFLHIYMIYICICICFRCCQNKCK
jgi:hypothetical protein